MVVPPCVGFEAFKDTTGPILFTEKSLHYWSYNGDLVHKPNIW